MRFTHHIWAALGWYDLARGHFLRQPYGAEATVARVRVDLLITVDAASGPTSGFVNRRVFPSVRQNLNIYQTTPSSGGESASGPWSHGGPNTAMSPGDTSIENSDRTKDYPGAPGRAHGRIVDDSANEVFDTIQRMLGQVVDINYRGPGTTRHAFNLPHTSNRHALRPEILSETSGRIGRIEGFTV